jgi:pyruvate formate lyase activating enzyme
MVLHEAFFYKQDKEGVICSLCAHECRVRDGRRGKCGVRSNIGGKLYSHVYGELVAEHVDPIEKKPLFHVLPGTTSYSIATMGCNFHCHHCQNSSISQVVGLPVAGLQGRKVEASAVVTSALRQGCASISYTYVEPTVFFEFAYDCAVEAQRFDIKNIFVSNGYISKIATRKIAPHLAAINIDVKSYRDDFYKKVCGARLQPVLECIQLMRELGVWVEVTTLLIPGLNDTEEEITGIASFLVSVDANIPWHVTAFHPTYRMKDRPPTSAESLKKARWIGLEAGLNFVYEGNVHGGSGENTFCPSCRECVIERRGFSIGTNKLIEGICPQCRTILPGVWK